MAILAVVICNILPGAVFTAADLDICEVVAELDSHQANFEHMDNNLLTRCLMYQTAGRMLTAIGIGIVMIVTVGVVAKVVVGDVWNGPEQS